MKSTRLQSEVLTLLILGQPDPLFLDVSARSLPGQQLLCLLGIILNCSKWGNSAHWEQI